MDNPKVTPSQVAIAIIAVIGLAFAAVVVNERGKGQAAAPANAAANPKALSKPFPCSGVTSKNPYGNCPRGLLCGEGGYCCSPSARAVCSARRQRGVDRDTPCACDYDENAASANAYNENELAGQCILTCDSVSIACGSTADCKQMVKECLASCAWKFPAEPAAKAASASVSSSAEAPSSPPSASAAIPADAASPLRSTGPINASKLAAEDEGFVDTRGGAGWGDKCWLHLRANRLDAAQAACDRAMEMNPASPQPRASLLFNQGLIAEKRGAKPAARSYFKQSLALRPHKDVDAALARVGAED